MAISRSLKWYYVDLDNIVPHEKIFNIAKFHDIEGNRVLELGPFEAWDTFTLELMNPREIISVEGSLENFMKCELVKERYLSKTKFKYRDIEEGIKFLGDFDFILANGVIHHLSNPVKVIKELATMTNRLWLGIRLTTGGFPYDGEIEVDGYKCRKLNFNDDAYHLGINGYGAWMYKLELLRLLKDVGFCSVIIVEDVDECTETENYHHIFAYREEIEYADMEDIYENRFHLTMLSDNEMKRLEERVRAERTTNPVDMIYLPILRKLFIVDGNHRYKIAKKVGLKKLPYRKAPYWQLESVIDVCLRYMEEKILNP